MSYWVGALLVSVFMLIAISASWTRCRGAPWTPTSMGMVHTMLSMADVGPDDLLYDLGCGDGRMIITAARCYGSRAVGIEIDPLRYCWCQILITLMRLRKQVRIVFGNLFSQDLRDADVITCYLLQDTNERLEGKFKRELRPGTRIVSNRFDFPGLVKVCEDGDAMLYHPN